MAQNVPYTDLGIKPSVQEDEEEEGGLAEEIEQEELDRHAPYRLVRESSDVSITALPRAPVNEYLLEEEKVSNALLSVS